MQIHEIDAAGYHTGQSRTVADNAPIPKGWRAGDLPELSDGEFAVWTGVGFRATERSSPAADIEAAELREKQVVGVNAERARRIDKGSSFAVPGVAEAIPLTGRDFDQSVYLALLMRAQGYKAAGVTDPVLTLRDRNDVIHSLTPDQTISLITQAMTWFESVMATSWAMKDGTGDFTGGIPTDYTSDTHWP